MKKRTQITASSPRYTKLKNEPKFLPLSRRPTSSSSFQNNDKTADSPQPGSNFEKKDKPNPHRDLKPPTPPPTPGKEPLVFYHEYRSETNGHATPKKSFRKSAQHSTGPRTRAGMTWRKLSACRVETHLDALAEAKTAPLRRSFFGTLLAACSKSAQTRSIAWQADGICHGGAFATVPTGSDVLQ